MQDYQPFTIAMIFVVNANPPVNWQPFTPHLVYWLGDPLLHVSKRLA